MGPELKDLANKYKELYQNKDLSGMFKLKNSLPTQDLKDLFTDYSTGKTDFNQLTSCIDNCASSTNS